MSIAAATPTRHRDEAHRSSRLDAHQQGRLVTVRYLTDGPGAHMVGAIRDPLGRGVFQDQLHSVRESLRSIGYASDYQNFSKTLVSIFANDEIDKALRAASTGAYSSFRSQFSEVTGWRECKTLVTSLAQHEHLGSMRDALQPYLPAPDALLLGFGHGALLERSSLFSEEDDHAMAELFPLAPETDTGNEFEVTVEVICRFCREPMLAKSTYEWSGELTLFVGTLVVPVCTTCVARSNEDPTYISNCLDDCEGEDDVPAPARRLQVVEGDATGDGRPHGRLRLVPTDEG